MAISSEDVLRTARLARLRITPDGLPRYRQECQQILDFFQHIKSIDISDIDVADRARTGACPLRDDNVAPSISRGAALRNAPDHQDGFFQVPRVIP